MYCHAATKHCGFDRAGSHFNHIRSLKADIPRVLTLLPPHPLTPPLLSAEPQQTDKMPETRQGVPTERNAEAQDVPGAGVWQSELRRKCVVVGKDVDDYIQKVMPEDSVPRPEVPEYKGGLFRMPKKGCDDYQSKLAGAVVSPPALRRRP